MTTTNTVADLIAILQTKDQDAKIEYIVAYTSGELLTVFVKDQAKPMTRMLKMFG